MSKAIITLEEFWEQENQQIKEAGSISFIARALVRATMPHRDSGDHIYTRQNGNFKLSMMSSEGLPYGALARILMIFFTTEAVKTSSRTIFLGDNMSEFMGRLGLVPTGGRWGSITRLRNQMGRLLGCAITCKYEDDEKRLFRNVVPIEAADEFWWKPVENPNQRQLFEASITLSQKFFEEISERPIPLDMSALREFSHSPMDIDFYCWLTHKNSYSTRSYPIPWEALQLQFGAGYPMTPQGKRNFKKKLINSMVRVAAIYPEALKLQTGENHLLYVPGKPHVPQKLITSASG